MSGAGKKVFLARATLSLTGPEYTYCVCKNKLVYYLVELFALIAIFSLGTLYGWLLISGILYAFILLIVNIRIILTFFRSVISYDVGFDNNGFAVIYRDQVIWYAFDGVKKIDQGGLKTDIVFHRSGVVPVPKQIDLMSALKNFFAAAHSQ